MDHKILHETIFEYVKPYVNLPGKGVALLGCTHYPWIYSAFEKKLEGWKVVNSASSIADLLERSDQLRGVLPSLSSQGAVLTPGSVEWIFTDPNAVPAFARQWCSV